MADQVLYGVFGPLHGNFEVMCACIDVSTTYCYLSLDNNLTIDDLSALNEKLFQARTKWFEIGLSLNVDNETLKSINIRNHENPDKCLIEMLTHRVQAIAPLTWRTVCVCLRSPTVGRNDVAKGIEEEMTKS